MPEQPETNCNTSALAQWFEMRPRRQTIMHYGIYHHTVPPECGGMSNVTACKSYGHPQHHKDVGFGRWPVTASWLAGTCSACNSSGEASASSPGIQFVSGGRGLPAQHGRMSPTKYTFTCPCNTHQSILNCPEMDVAQSNNTATSYQLLRPVTSRQWRTIWKRAARLQNL